MEKLPVYSNNKALTIGRLHNKRFLEMTANHYLFCRKFKLNRNDKYKPRTPVNCMRYNEYVVVLFQYGLNMN